MLAPAWPGSLAIPAVVSVATPAVVSPAALTMQMSLVTTTLVGTVVLGDSSKQKRPC